MCNYYEDKLTHLPTCPLSTSYIATPINRTAATEYYCYMDILCLPAELEDLKKGRSVVRNLM